MALQARVDKARALVDAGAVKSVRVDGKGRMRGWRMPSVTLPGRWYEVYARIERPNGSRALRASFWCNCCSPGALGQEPIISKCEGNQRTVCYHCLASIIRLARARRMTVQFVDSGVKAQALSRLGTVVELHGEGQAQPAAFAIMRKRNKRRRKDG